MLLLRDFLTFTVLITLISPLFSTSDMADDSVRKDFFVSYTKSKILKRNEIKNKKLFKETTPIINVRTMFDTVRQENVAENDVMARVTYRCLTKLLLSQKETKSGLEYINYYGNAQKTCKQTIPFNGNKMTNCEINTSDKDILPVKLVIPHYLQKLQISYENCQGSNQKIMFRFYRNYKEINFRDDNRYYSNASVFSTTDMRLDPIDLIVKFINKTKIIQIRFLLEEPKENFCELNCNLPNCPCQPLYGKKLLEKFRLFKNKTLWNKKPRSAVDQTCNFPCYFLRNQKKIKLCQDQCFNMGNCSYMCGKFEMGSAVETFYYTYPFQWTTGKVTKERVEWNKIPKEKALFNECSNATGLCVGKREYCIDDVVGFHCSNNATVNVTRCNELKLKSQVPYWICPKSEEYQFLSREFMKLPMKQKIENFPQEIQNYYGGKNFSKTQGIYMLNFYEDLVFRYYSNNGKTMQTENDNIYFEPIKGNVTKISLKNSNSFVEFEVTDTDNNLGRQSFSQPRLSIIDYANISFNNEINETEKQVNDLKKAKLTVPKDRNITNRVIEMYRASSLLSISAHGQVKGIIKFRIPRKVKIPTSYSWLTEFEEVCGFLESQFGWKWDTTGCKLVKNDAKGDYCQCNHMTNFAMLFSVKLVNEKHLQVFQILSIIGGIINCLSLLLFIVFVLFINSRDKLRLDQLNVALCLFLGFLIFLLGGLFYTHNVACKLSAAFTQFFLLAAFMWKLILGINVVKMVASVRYQEDWLIKFRFLFIAIGYTVPLLIVVISAGLFWDGYGEVSENVCWIIPSSPAFLTFLVPVSIIIAVNLLVLAYIAKVLLLNYMHTRKTKVNESNELLVFVQLLVSMGFTWIPCYLATIYLSAMYIMLLALPLQGLMMFMLVVVINKENRDKVTSFIVSITTKTSSSISDRNTSGSKSISRSKGTEQTDGLLSSSSEAKSKIADTDEKVMQEDNEVSFSNNHQNINNSTSV